MLDKLQAIVSLRPGTRVTLLCPRQSGREFVEGKPGWTLAGTFYVGMQDFHDHGRVSAHASVPEPWNSGPAPLLEL